MEWIRIISDMMVGVSAVIVAIIAYFGLEAWKRELKGRATYQTAKELLKAVYEVRNAFEYVRSQAVYADDYPPELCNTSGDLLFSKQLEGARAKYKKRVQVLDRSFSKLGDNLLSAQVEWGEDFREKISDLIQCNNLLKKHIRRRLENLKRKLEDPGWDESRLHKVEELVIFADFKDDKFLARIDKSVREIEKWLFPKI